jgi:hypothetical protein
MIRSIFLGLVPTLVVGIAVLTLATPERNALVLGQVRPTLVSNTHHMPSNTQHKPIHSTGKPKPQAKASKQMPTPTGSSNSNEQWWGGHRGYHGYRGYRGWSGWRGYWGYRGYYASGTGEQLE